MGRDLRIASVVALVLAAGGCQNPFDPSADVELTRITSRDPNFNTIHTIALYQSSQLSSLINIDFSRWQATFHFTYKNKVAAYINNVTITYTDTAGNPVTAYKSTGGRSFKMTFRLEGVRDNSQTDEGEGGSTDMTLNVVDRRVVDEILSPSYPTDKTMVANILFQGQDENGYDLRLEGQIPIFLYP